METPSEIAPGQVLAGKFRIERVLGRGGMGIVVAAHHLVLDELVALKFLLPEALGQGEAVARFEREARAAVRIKSEHVARVADVGHLDSGAPYMVMELLRGSDLGALLRDRGPLPVEEVADYLLQAGEAIAEAHSLGIIHRDLKPSNLFLTHRADGSPCIKVLDFGISKLTGQGLTPDPGITRSTAVMGSPLYMSPEQLLSARNVDVRTDVWALGVICHELLAGSPPFEAETMPQLCMTIAHAPPAPLRARRPDVPAELEQLILRCLEKDPQKRVASVAEFAREIVRFGPASSRLSADRIDRMNRASNLSATELAVGSPRTEQADSSPRFHATETVNGFGRTESERPPSQKRLVIVAAAVVIFAIGVAVVMATLRDPEQKSATASAPIVATSAAASSTSSATPVVPTPSVAVVPASPLKDEPASPPPAAPVSAATSSSAPRPAPKARRVPASAAPAVGAQQPASPPNPVAPSPKSGHGSLGGRL